MTIKHIEFYDSEVMRELARQSISKGTVSKPSVEEVVVKVAATQQKYQPSDNLFLDVVRLINGLREKGLVREAAALQEKLVLFKQAEKAFSDVLDDAHPEGDAEMAEATDGLGAVETLESQHQKIVDVVKKNPTGKNAQSAFAVGAKRAALADVINKVASILLEKNAQETYEQLMGLETEEAKSQKTKVENRGQAIEKINAAVTKFVPPVLDGIKAIKQQLLSLSFDRSQISRNNEPYLQLYAKKSNINADELKKFGETWDRVYGAGAGADANVIFNTINSLKNDQQIMAYTDQVAPGLYNKYFPPKPKQEFQTTWEQAKSHVKEQVYQTMGGGLVDFVSGQEKSSAQIHGLVNEMNTIMVGKLNRYVGDATREGATKVLREEMKRLSAPLDQVEASLASITALEPDAKTNFPVSSALKNATKQLDEFAKVATKGELFNVLNVMNKDVAGSIRDQLISFYNNLKNADATVSSIPLSTGDFIVKEETANALATGFKGMARDLSKYVRATFPKGSRQYNDYALDVKMFLQVGDALAKGSNKSYVEIYSGIQQYLPKATSIDLLQQTMNGYSAALQKLIPPSDSVQVYNANGPVNVPTTVTDVGTSAASANDGQLQKVSQRLNPEGGAPAAAKPAGKPAGATYKAPAPGTGSFTPVNLSDPAQNAVAKMQQQLSLLANRINNDPNLVAKLLGTGHPKHPYLNQFDGKWGPQTQTALEAANGVLAKMELPQMTETRARWENGGYTESEAVEKAANDNMAKIGAALQRLGGAPGGAAAGPKVMTYGRYNGVAVTNTDLSSLRAFYRFVVKNKFLQETTAVNEQAQGQTVTGVPYPGFVAILGEILTDAKSKYTDTDPTSAHYYQSAMNLWRQLSDYGRRFATDDKNFLVTLDSFPEEGGVGGQGGAGAGGKGKGKAPGATYQGKPGEEGEDLEGTNWKRRREKQLGSIFPINPENANIDISSRWYQDMAQRWNVPDILSFRVFQSTPAPSLAEMFFPSGDGSASSPQKFAQFLNELRKQMSEAVVQWGRQNRDKFNSDDIALMTELLRDWNEVITYKLKQLSLRPVG